MRRLIHRIETLFEHVNLRGRMFIIYILGGILPLLCVHLYTYQQTKEVLIEQQKEAEIAELGLIGDSIRQSMSVANELSKRLYFDETIERIAFTKYEDYADIIEEYRNYQAISDYLKYYHQDISSIHVYLENQTITDNEYFVRITDSIRREDWYQKTLQKEGNPYWSYTYNTSTKKCELRLTRVLYTKEMEQIGVLSIVMQNDRTQEPVEDRENETLLAYKDSSIVHANFDTDENEILPFLTECEAEIEEDSSFATENREVTYQGQTCLLSVVRISEDYSDEDYFLVSICPYDEIVKEARNAAARSMVPFLFCFLFAVVIILWFTHHYTARITTFKNEMHKAATGNFAILEEIGGNDEITELYADLHLMMNDITKLMNEVMEEKLQKESLNARQKEVEFKMLASQINPHFLYNTLETIRMKAKINGQGEIAELAKMLAKIMRRNIQVGEAPQTLKTELQLVMYYLKIQDYRFHDRITSEIVVDEAETDGLMIMPLLIQPFVENAFAHGLEEKEADGKIIIRVEVKEELWISIEDNGKGMTKEKQQELMQQMNDFENLDRTHIGVCNANQRIRLKYGEKYGVAFETEPGKGTKMILKLPIVRET